MSEDADLLDLVVERLAVVRLRLGPATFRDAAERALNGIARAALAEAERRAGKRKRRRRGYGVVVQFPLHRRLAETLEKEK